MFSERLLFFVPEKFGEVSIPRPSVFLLLLERWTSCV